MSTYWTITGAGGRSKNQRCVPQRLLLAQRNPQCMDVRETDSQPFFSYYYPYHHRTHARATRLVNIISSLIARAYALLKIKILNIVVCAGI